jgi:hypothetical protein
MYQSLQGNIGLGKAIEYFTSHQIPVSLPLNDTQSYDLVADFHGKLQRVQTKTSRYSETDGKSYMVQLKNTGGNKTGTTRIVPFDNTSCDYVFIYTGANKTYLIPSDRINTTNSITVGVKYSEYEVVSKTLNDFVEDFKN